MGKFLDYGYRRALISAVENADGQITEITEAWFSRTAFDGSEADALAAAGLPANNAQHPDHPNLRVAGRDPERQSDGQTWNIDIVYKPVSPISVSETYKLILVEYGTHKLQQDVTHNLGTGDVLVDANGKPFQQTIQVPRAYPWIKIVKKQKGVSRDDVITKSGTINNAQVTVAGITVPKHAGLIEIHATEVDERDYEWEISYEVSVRYFQLSNYVDFAGALQAGPDEQGWNEGIINQGFYFYDTGATSDLVRAMEKVRRSDNTVEERPSSTPILLDENGEALAEGATPLSILLQVYPESDWSGLGLNDL